MNLWKDIQSKATQFRHQKHIQVVRIKICVTVSAPTHLPSPKSKFSHTSRHWSKSFVLVCSLNFHGGCSETVKGKGKAHPRRDHECPEGGVKVKFYSFFNLSIMGVGGQRHSGRGWKISPPTGIRNLDRPARTESEFHSSTIGATFEIGTFVVNHKTKSGV